MAGWNVYGQDRKSLKMGVLRGFEDRRQRGLYDLRGEKIVDGRVFFEEEGFFEEPHHLRRSPHLRSSGPKIVSKIVMGLVVLKPLRCQSASQKIGRKKEPQKIWRGLFGAIRRRRSSGVSFFFLSTEAVEDGGGLFVIRVEKVEYKELFRYPEPKDRINSRFRRTPYLRFRRTPCLRRSCSLRSSDPMKKDRGSLQM